MSDRKQYVSFNEAEQKDIVCGVPLGYISGPVLCILYVDDINNRSDVLDFILFADNNTILYSHSNIENQINIMNKELNEVSKWVKANKLSVNASKTNYMILETPRIIVSRLDELDTNVILTILIWKE